MIPRLYDLKATGRKPRVHPNGFIQFDLDEGGAGPWQTGRRLHVWSVDPLPAQKTRHTIHDHAFDMHSHVILGQLTNVIYSFSLVLVGPEEKEPYRLHQARYIIGAGPSEETALVPIGEVGVLYEFNRQTIRAGESYAMPMKQLHDSIPTGLTASIMKKTKTASDYRPVVAVPFGIEPDNNFRRDQLDENLLWSIIETALKKASTNFKDL